jgi:HPt (histidine-containing phosphotransfer) domain-containing protein
VFALACVGSLTWLWERTRSLNPDDHAHIDSSLRELRSLDRTINQDVLRARYQLIDSYEPVLRSYRRIEQLEAVLASPPLYLDSDSRRELSRAVTEYRASVSAKQAVIEAFKYRSAELKELLGYLPGAGTGVATAATGSNDKPLALAVNRVLQQALLYNLTSDEKYATAIRSDVDVLAAAGERAHSRGVRRRVRTLATNIRRLLDLKPEVDRLLRRIFDEPVIQHEESVAAIYYSGYAAAEHLAARYRIGLYGLCVALLTLVAYGFRRLQLSAKALSLGNERLEERVAERTRELDSRNREMRAVLDNVDQALFTVDLEGRVSRERSAALDRWFPHASAGSEIWTVVGLADTRAAEWLRLGWDQLREGFLPAEVILDQLPRSLTFQARHYEIDYRPIGDESRIETILLVVSDVTEAVEQARREVDQREQLVIFQHLIGDRSDFMQFFAEGERLARAVHSGDRRDRSTLMRNIHTLKGNCALYGVASVASACHDVESKILDGDRANSGGLDEELRNDLRPVDLAWSSFARKVRALTESAQERGIELTAGEFDFLRKAVAAGKSATDLTCILKQLEREPAARRLARLSEHAKSLCRRLGKGEVAVTTESNQMRLDIQRWAPFWGTFVHLLRNAVDHGIEPADERLALGKPAAGQIGIRTTWSGDRAIVEISDDGRGIDWEAVRTKGAEVGLVARTDHELLEILFQGGISTKSGATEISGRGAGVGACYAACVDLGGELTIQTARNEGTTFRFSIPADDTVVVTAMTTATKLVAQSQSPPPP